MTCEWRRRSREPHRPKGLGCLTFFHAFLIALRDAMVKRYSFGGQIWSKISDIETRSSKSTGYWIRKNAVRLLTDNSRMTERAELELIS